MTKLLQGKTAVITGAGRGIGKATALLFAKHGADILISDMDEAPLSETLHEIKSFGIKAISLKANVVNKDDCSRMMDEAYQLNGPIDVLANIAGITRDKMIHKMTLDDWNFVLNVNLTGTFNTIQAVEPYMRDSAKKELVNGNIKTRSIINISSTSGKGNIGQANYSASKAGVEGLTKTVAKEWARFNIICNAIAPGFIETRLTLPREEGSDFGIPEDQKKAIDEMQKKTGLSRSLGQPEDIANVALFFASDLAGFVTGQVLTVAGGMIGSI